jgi:ribosomal protein L37AE/L43A
MPEPRNTDSATRPTMCPFCQGKVFDTLAKVITVTTLWRCRECEETWTIARHPGPSTRPY